MKCGVGDYTASLCEALGKYTDTTVGVITSRSASCSDRPAHNFELFPLVDNWKLSESIGVIKFIKRWRPDVVHVQYPTQGYFGGGHLSNLLPPILYLLGIKVVQTWHEYYRNDTEGWISLPKSITPGPLVVVRPNFREHLSPFFRWLHRNRLMPFIPNASALPRVILNDIDRAEIHRRYAPPSSALIAYFGFIYPNKGIEQLFEIADPAKHHLVLIGAFNESDDYHTTLKKRSTEGPWAGKVTFTGFLPATEAGSILAAADAVVLPFQAGGGLWNTSLHGAALQGTFVLTTSQEQQGYDPSRNIFFARPGDIDSMRKALGTYTGRRNSDENIKNFPNWESIAAAHMSIYRSISK
jgi:glycosyltransferase involved in cell wall biosynthesis